MEIDLALRILEYRDREADRQIDRVGAFDLVAKGELVDEDVVLSGQLLLVEQVVQVDRKRALGYRVARVFGRVGREFGQLDVLRLGLDIDEGERGKGVDRAADSQWRVTVDLAVEFDVGGRRRVCAEGSHLSSDLGQVGRVVGLDEIIGVVDLTAVKRESSNFEVGRERSRAGRGSRTRSGCAGVGARRGRCRRGCCRRAWRGCRRRYRPGAWSAMRPRERGRRLLRAGRHVAQVQAPVAIENDARIEVAQIERRDMDLRRPLAQLKIYPVRAKGVPAQKTVVGHLVEHSHPAERRVAAIAHAHLLALIRHSDSAVHGQSGARDRRVEMTCDVGIEWRQVETARDHPKIELERHRGGRAGHLEAALAVENAVQVDPDRLGEVVRDAF